MTGIIDEQTLALLVVAAVDVCLSEHKAEGVTTPACTAVRVHLPPSMWKWSLHFPALPAAWKPSRPAQRQ